MNVLRMPSESVVLEGTVLILGSLDRQGDLVEGVSFKSTVPVTIEFGSGIESLIGEAELRIEEGEVKAKISLLRRLDFLPLIRRGFVYGAPSGKGFDMDELFPFPTSKEMTKVGNFEIARIGLCTNHADAAIEPLRVVEI